jgi:hypothetical protein
MKAWQRPAGSRAAPPSGLICRTSGGPPVSVGSSGANAVGTAPRLEPARIEQATGIDAARKVNIAFAISILPTERTFAARECDTIAPAPYISRTRSAFARDVHR